MVSQLYIVRAGACALDCGAAEPDLYVLNLVRQEEPHLRPAEADEIGVCLDCWGKVMGSIKETRLGAARGRLSARRRRLRKGPSA